MLALYLRINHFRHLENITFTVYTDCEPLTKALSTKQDNYSPRKIRRLEFIPQSASSIQYIKVNDNG